MRVSRRTAASLLLTAVTASLLLAGCAGGDTMSQDTRPEVRAVPVEDVVAQESSREIIRIADMVLRVDSVQEAIDRIDSITAQAGGRIASEEVVSTGDARYGTITARVPAERLDSVITAVGDLGQVLSLSVVAEDVTAQGADLDARIEALEVSIARLRQLLATAETTQDLIDIESELTARQAELDSLVAQRAVLSDQVAQSTLTVSISPSSESPTWTPPGFVSGLESGWNALRTVTATLVTLAGFLLPFVGALSVIAVPIIVLVVLVRRRK